MVKYQPRKANIVADALSRSQRPATEDTEEATAREEVLQLMSSSVEPQGEDLQTWKRAYQEDPRLKDSVVQASSRPTMWWIVFDSSRSYWRSSRVIYRKLAVPQSLPQKIMRENHDVPSVGHVGMRKELWNWWIGISIGEDSEAMYCSI